ncbi:D-alanyl-D-alanine carboxypeptidase family protein [Cellulosimicrobium sp. XJ-DQ-B-000]|uniref:D-alanyl-D-alanine carboxypeptidase family protein n=1 Tax=Cellulosimicrobium sp. XJ-DQ-B-000 TaxID=3072182 RepID=UPI0028088420|nr:D-alanyl-D-alanine carboxypeptidase family protein [Cellulosimicrobium sp. XJ-DQ-B-000]MDQ8042623.1 D-alanyl-D-alanine carboxypeptidase family protein [Cellulosimicrobium sp. XJ-DQ-B-000]
MSTTAEHEGADDAPVTPEPAPAAAVGPESFGRRARAVSHVLISSALAITLAAALAGSAQPRPGASFFAQEATTATQVAALSSTLGAGLDEGQQLDGAIEVLATANALDDGHVSPPVEQARAELGMLLATYLAQQDAARRVPAPLVPDGDLDLDESLDGAQVPELPEPLGPGTGAGAGTDDTTTGTDDETDDPATDRPAQQPATVDAAGDVATDAVRTAATPTAPSPSPTSSPSPGASTDPSPSDSPSPGGTPSPAPGTSTPLDPTAPGGTGSAGDAGSPGDRTLPEDEVPAPDGVAPGELDGSQDPADGSADSGDGDHAEGDDHAHGDVTLEDVLASATTLAELLGTDLVPVGVVPAAGATALAGTTLAERLAEVVERYAGSTAQYQNGRIPPEALCALDFAPGKTLRCDAAEQLEALAAEFEKEFGYALKITDAYRPYDEQVRLKAVKPYLAAVPGTSQHGWGLAIDVGGNVPSGTSLEYVWLRTHGPDYGWDNPAWARPNGSKPEPWHFEFFAAGKMPTRYTPAEGSAPSTPQKPATPSAPAPKPTTPPAPQPPAPTPTPTPTEPPPTKPTDPPPPTTVAVPANLVGRQQATVEAALQGAGLKVSVTTKVDEAAPGTVLSVTPGSGTQVAPGSTVAIVVSSGPPPEPEPEPSPEPTDPAPEPTVAPTQAPTAPGTEPTTP